MADILNSLGFDSTVFFLQIGLFVFLWITLNHLFWKPTLAHLGRRKQTLVDAYQTVEDTRLEMEHLRTEYQQRISQVEAEARSHIHASIKDAQEERERLLSEARTAAEENLHKGSDALQTEKLEALNSLLATMVGIAVGAAEKALGGVGDAVALRSSVEQSVNRTAASN